MTQPSGRCPRCGYVLRYNTRGYSCDFCGLKGTRSVSSIVADAERNLREKVQGFLEPHPQRRVIYRVPTSQPLQSCVFCGLSIPFGTVTCPFCGKSRAENFNDQDRRVFEYIAAHDGAISISRAAIDLSISTDMLIASIERLKASGVLKQE